MSRTNHTCKYNDERHRRLREIARRYRAKHPWVAKRENAKTRARHRDEYIAKQKIYYSKHPLAYIHHGIMKRCAMRKGATKTQLKYYAERGITVCEEWREFPNFEAWALSHGYRRGLQIDRIDPNKGYSPENCRFVTAHENAVNRRSSIKVEWNGELIEFARLYDMLKPSVSYATAYDRLHKIGWSVKDALLKSLNIKRRKAI